jgi:N6-L-threonylcarbamoyladenine synthase
VLSQIEEHAAFGGVVPEIAARAHVEALDGIVEAALRRFGHQRSPISTRSPPPPAPAWSAA